MPDLEVTVFNQKLRLSYLEDEKERLTNAIKILNESWKKFSNLHGKVSDLKMLISTIIFVITPESMWK